jgi:phenylacetaldehyde dehydrogenase
MGPLVSNTHAAKVAEYIAEGKRAGASILCGGDVAGDNASFITPTVLTGVTHAMRIAREEVFGPVLVAMPFDDVEEVITAANDSDYGLAASIWTEGLSNAIRIANHLRTGTVWINSHAMYDASLPIGGVKQSGWGRDSGQAAIENYLDLKTVCAVV